MLLTKVNFEVEDGGSAKSPALLKLFWVIILTFCSWNCTDFWITDSFYYEQPEVTHLNELIVVLYTEDQTYTFASTSTLNELVGSKAAVASSI